MANLIFYSSSRLFFGLKTRGNKHALFSNFAVYIADAQMKKSI